MDGTQALWQRPHVQAWLVALKQNEEDGGQVTRRCDGDGMAIYHYPTDDLINKWRGSLWQITLAGHTFQGRFDSLDRSIYHAYVDYLGHEEHFPPLTIEVALEGPLTLYTLPIGEGNVDTVDERGWPIHFYIYRQTLCITAHLAAFTPVDIESHDSKSSRPSNGGETQARTLRT